MPRGPIGLNVGFSEVLVAAEGSLLHIARTKVIAKIGFRNKPKRAIFDFWCGAPLSIAGNDSRAKNSTL